MGSEQHNKSEMDALDRIFGVTIGARASHQSPVAEKVTQGLVGFASHLTNVQASQLICYNCEPIDGVDIPEAARRFSVFHMGSKAETVDDDDFN